MTASLPSVNSRLCVLEGNHISGGGVNLMHFLICCVLGAFLGEFGRFRAGASFEGGWGGRRPPKEKEKKKKEKKEKKEKREKKKKKKKERKKGTMNKVKLLHIKCCFFSIFQ